MKRRLKILYVCHRFPYPPSRGGKIRPFNMISHLARSHEVTVASLVRSAAEEQEGAGLRQYCHRILHARVSRTGALIRMLARLPTTVPSSMGYFFSPELARQVRRELAEHDYDLVFVHCSSVAQYVENARGMAKILDFGDMDSQKWLDYAGVRGFPVRLGYWLEGRKLQRFERRLAEKFDLCTCTTRAEKETLDSYGCRTPTGWFPNGVDYDYFSPADSDYEAGTICFIGRMDYYPNQECMLWFCRHVLPLVRERLPDARLTIIGASPSREIMALGRLPGVTVTGSVPDVRPYVRASAVNVAPLNIARGTQNKILESMAMGVPVVASEKAAGGIDAVAGEHFLVAATAEEYRDTICSLLTNREYREQYARAGRARVVTNHNWAHSMQRMDTLVDQALALAREQGDDS